MASKSFGFDPKNFLCKFTILYGPYLGRVGRPVVLKKTFLSLGFINSRLVFDTQLDKANHLASKISGFVPKNFLCKFTIHGFAYYVPNMAQ